MTVSENSIDYVVEGAKPIKNVEESGK